MSRGFLISSQKVCFRGKSGCIRGYVLELLNADRQFKVFISPAVEDDVRYVFGSYVMVTSHSISISASPLALLLDALMQKPEKAFT